jgi:hypothetical protein
MKFSKANPKPQTIQVPISQVTPDPVPGYTPQDFWRELGEENAEFDRFQQLTRSLLAVPKSEIDEKRDAPSRR